jgi:hypothetical protein
VCCGFAIVAVAGCGGGGGGDSASGAASTITTPPSTETSTPTPTTAPPSTAAGTPRCTAATLTGTVRQEDAAAGNRYATLLVTNKGTGACTLYGYGGLQLVDAQGNPTPTNLTRTPDPGPVLLTLKPGGSAGKKLHWGVVPTGDEPDTGPCQPASAGARVIPPDETEPFAVRFDFGSVCAKGTIEGSADFTS